MATALVERRPAQSEMIIVEVNEYQGSFPLSNKTTYSHDNLHTCVCNIVTLMDCRLCGKPQCGNCLDTEAHAARFHA